MCGHFCIGFIGIILCYYVILLECTNIFSSNDYEINVKIILKYFQLILKRLKWKKCSVLFVVNIENLKTLK